MAISFLLTTIVLSACAAREPVIPADAAEEIRDAFGYVLAPIYMPKGLEFIEAHVTAPSLPPEAPTDVSVTRLASLYYGDGTLEPDMPLLLMGYPYPWPVSGRGLPGLETPEAAVSEITVGGRAALLTRGGWPDDVYRVYMLTQEAPTDPEWDDGAALALQFAFNSPDDSVIGVTLFARPNPEEWLSVEELVRIAESIVIVD